MQTDIYQVLLSVSLTVKSAHCPKKRKKPLIWKIFFILFVKIFCTLEGIVHMPVCTGFFYFLVNILHSSASNMAIFNENKDS